MNEQWEMCIIYSSAKTSQVIYSPTGVEKTELAWNGRDEAIQALLFDGWEPFTASECYPPNQMSYTLYFRRRIA